MSNRQRMQSDNPLFDQVNPEMASRRGNGGEPVSPAAVAASSSSSSTAHASAAAADPPPPDFVVTRAMKDEALEMAKDAAAEDGDDWNKFDKKKQRRRLDTQLKLVVAEARAEAAKAGESAAKADLAARDAAAFKPTSVWNALHEPFPIADFGKRTYSSTALHDHVHMPDEVRVLTREAFEQLPEVLEIVKMLKKLEAKNAGFFATEAQRSVNLMKLDREGGVERIFTTVNNLLEWFFANNDLAKNFPFLFRGKTEKTNADPDFTYTDRTVDEDLPFVVGDFKPPTYNSRGNADSKKAHLTETVSMDVKHGKEKEANEYREGNAISPIVQVFDYTLSSAVLFGMLETYAHMWLSIRDCRKNVVIVESFNRNCCPPGRMSVVQALVVFLFLAKSKAVPQSLINAGFLVRCDAGCKHKAPPTARAPAAASSSASNSSGGKRKTKGKGKNAGSSASTKNTLTIDVQDPEDVSMYLYRVETGVYGDVQDEFIPGARTGTMVRYRTSFGEDVVSKKADLYKRPELKAELQNEVLAYDKMRDLQGAAIPVLKGYGLDPRSHFMYTLTTSHGGVPLSALRGMFEEEKALAAKALDAVHSVGVLHRDIKADNILVERSDETRPGKVRLVDFAFANVGSSEALQQTAEENARAKLAFDAEAQSEREKLAELLQELPTAYGTD